MFKNILILLAALAVLVSTSGNAGAVTYTGSLFGDGGGVTATEDWSSSSSVFSWTVEDVGSSNGFVLWQYDYWFSVPSKQISHMVIEISDGAVIGDFEILTETTGSFDTIQIHDGSGNPGIPEAFYGMKFDTGLLNEHIAFLTTRAPVWGDFYAKDGKAKGVFVTAWSTGFTASDTDPSDAAANGSIDNHILRPDTAQVTVVPEPVSSTLFLLGSAALGFRRFRSMNK